MSSGSPAWTTVPGRKYFPISAAIARARTSAGMSPALSAPSSECTSTPSHTSIATFARYSCDRCIGLRVWNAAIRVQPRRSNSARVSAGVMKSAPYFALNPPSESTFTGPARFTFGCCMTIATPGCAPSLVRKTRLHSRALSIVYFSLTVIVARGAPLSGSVSAISSPALIELCVVGRLRGNRPEQPPGGGIALAPPFPVGARHEAFERREAADPEHDEVAFLARAHAHRPKRLRPFVLRGERFPGQRERLQGSSTMGCDKTGHSAPPCLLR